MNMLGVIHDRITQREESTWLKRLSEEISMIIYRGNIRDNKTTLLYKFSNEIMTSVYVFRASMILRVVRGINRSFVI